MSKTINLGRVTAYADAVAAGYTGTREQFAQDLANAANYAAESHANAEAASDAAETATAAASAASLDADAAHDDAATAHSDAEAALSFKTAAETAATTASTKSGEAANSASQAATSASGAAGSATAASGSATAAAGSATNAAASETAAAGSATSAAGSASAAAQTLVDVNAAGATQVAAITAKGEEVLESIPSDYTELSQDVDDLKSDLNYGEHAVKGILNDNELINRFISINKTWLGNGKSYMIAVPNNSKSIAVTANSNYVSVVCLLEDNTFKTSGSVTNFSSDDIRHVVTAGQTDTFTIPNDCKYINILHDADSGTIYTPDAITFMVEQQSLVGLKNDNWFGSYVILGLPWDSNGDSKEGEKSSATSANVMASDYIPIPVTSGKMLVFPVLWDTAANSNIGWCLYDKDGNTIPGRSATVPVLKGENDPFIATVKVYLPDNAKYFRTTYWSDAFREGKDIPEFSYSIIDIPDEWKPITHDLPVDTFMQNAIRRARQLTDIKWTPRVNIPRYSMIGGGNKHFLDWFYADREYTGIPYSGAGDDETHWSTIKDWGYTHNWVGQHIPIEAFVTAARYPNSIMGEKASQSAVSYDSSPYGDVCTALVNYVVDGPTPLRGISGFFNTPDFRSSKKTIADTDMNKLSIGDFLYTSAHVIFISDIMRDENGNVTNIEMSEETTVGNNNNTVLGTKFGGVARRKMWDINEFKSLYSAYTLYRRLTFYGIPYIKSKYVNTGNEGDMDTRVDMACIPYLGEGAIYREGYVHNSKICIGATGFTSLVVLKDGEPFGTFDVTGLTEVSVGFSAIGQYEAYLTDGTTRATSCHWSVEAMPQ